MASRKNTKEARAERTTWFALVLIFILLSFDKNRSVPDYLAPMLVGLVLLVSGAYQLRNGWRVSPFVWMIGSLMIAAGVYGWYFVAPIDLQLVGLAGTVGIILFGILTNES